MECAGKQKSLLICYLHLGTQFLQFYGKMLKERHSYGMKVLWVPTILSFFIYMEIQEQGKRERKVDDILVLMVENQTSLSRATQSISSDKYETCLIVAATGQLGLVPAILLV